LSAAATDSNVTGMMTSTRIITSITVAASVALPPTAFLRRSNSGQVAIASTPAKTSAEMNGCSTRKMPMTTIAAPPKRRTLSKLAWMEGIGWWLWLGGAA
jgi:branched-subunit amino acid ABC-type transport system permease component